MINHRARADGTGSQKRIAEEDDQRVGHRYASPAMREVLERVSQASGTSSTVLFTGESGSGKDYLARRVHDLSNRRNKPFILINCGAIPENLAESELFGHEKGAFTGAAGRQKGPIELARGGTLLLNEIGELSIPLQVKLLSFLDTKTFRRVGGQKQVEVDVRIIAATNRDLVGEVGKGRFRPDLFYRLDVFSIVVPPLRKRKEDLPVLIDQILERLVEERRIPFKPQIDPAAFALAAGYHWPGNVRELNNILEESIITATGGAITADLFHSILERRSKVILPLPSGGSRSAIIREILTKTGGKPPRDKDLSIKDKRRIKEECLDRGMTQVEVAKALGVSQPTVCRWRRALTR